MKAQIVWALSSEVPLAPNMGLGPTGARYPGQKSCGPGRRLSSAVRGRGQSRWGGLAVAATCGVV